MPGGNTATLTPPPCLQCRQFERIEKCGRGLYLGRVVRHPDPVFARLIQTEEEHLVRDQQEDTWEVEEIYKLAQRDGIPTGPQLASASWKFKRYYVTCEPPTLPYAPKP